MKINSYTCTGRLTRDPELKTLPGGTSVCELRLAVEGMGRGREVGYIDVSVYGKGGQAAAEHLSTGWLVAVEGHLEYHQWQTEHGTRVGYRVIGTVEFLAQPANPRSGRTPQSETALASASAPTLGLPGSNGK